MSNIDLARLRVKSLVGRLPDGYFCKVSKVERSKRVLVYDAHLGRSFWVSWKTLRAKWRVPGGR